MNNEACLEKIYESYYKGLETNEELYDNIIQFQDLVKLREDKSEEKFVNLSKEEIVEGYGRGLEFLL